MTTTTATAKRLYKVCTGEDDIARTKMNIDRNGYRLSIDMDVNNRKTVEGCYKVFCKAFNQAVEDGVIPAELAPLATEFDCLDANCENGYFKIEFDGGIFFEAENNDECGCYFHLHVPNKQAADVEADINTDNLKEEPKMAAEVATGYIFTVYENNGTYSTECATLGDDVYHEVIYFAPYFDTCNGWELKTATGKVIIKGDDAPDFTEIVLAVAATLSANEALQILENEVDRLNRVNKDLGKEIDFGLFLYGAGPEEVEDSFTKIADNRAKIAAIAKQTETLKAAVACDPRNQTTADTDGTEDDTDREDPFDFLPDIDELSDVDSKPAQYKTLHDYKAIFFPNGNVLEHINVGGEQIRLHNGKVYAIRSARCLVSYDAITGTYTTGYTKYVNNPDGTSEKLTVYEGQKLSQKEFWATMVKNGFCSIDNDTPDLPPADEQPADIMKKYKSVCWIIKHRVAKNGRHMWFDHTGQISKAEAADNLNKWGLTIDQYLAAEEQQESQWALEREMSLKAYRHARHIEEKIRRDSKPIDDSEDVFDLLPDLDELNDVSEDVTVKELFFHEQGTIYNIIIVGQDRVWFKDGKLIRIHSYKYDASFDNRNKKYSAAIVENDNFKPKTFNTEEEFFAEMERRGACSFDTPDKTALADSLNRAMKIAMTNYQNFCRARNLTAAEDELKLYNICRKALSELWRR